MSNKEKKIRQLYGSGIYEIDRRKYNFNGTNGYSGIPVPEEDALKLLELKSPAPDYLPIIQEVKTPVKTAKDKVKLLEKELKEAKELLKKEEENQKQEEKNQLSSKEIDDLRNAAKEAGIENPENLTTKTQLEKAIEGKQKEKEEKEQEELYNLRKEANELSITGVNDLDKENLEEAIAIAKAAAVEGEEIPWEEKSYNQKRAWARKNGYPVWAAVNNIDNEKAVNIEDWFASLEPPTE